MWGEVLCGSDLFCGSSPFHTLDSAISTQISSLTSGLQPLLGDFVPVSFHPSWAGNREGLGIGLTEALSLNSPMPQAIVGYSTDCSPNSL